MAGPIACDAALRLFGRHEIGRAQHLAGQRHVRIHRQPLGQAEVGDAGLIRRINEDIGGLEVPVQDAVLMGVVHRLGNGLEVSRRAFGGQRSLADDLRQRAAFDIVHREVVLALVDTDLVDGDDVRMLQVGDGLGFGLEALHDFGLGELAGEHQLYRNDAVETLLTGLIDDTHAAAGDFLQQLVVAERTRRAECGLAPGPEWPRPFQQQVTLAHRRRPSGSV